MSVFPEECDIPLKCVELLFYGVCGFIALMITLDWIIYVSDTENYEKNGGRIFADDRHYQYVLPLKNTTK